MPYAFECKFIKHSDMAVLVEHSVSRIEHWIPRSMIIETDHIREEGEYGELTIQSWFARKLGLK